MTMTGTLETAFVDSGEAFGEAVGYLGAPKIPSGAGHAGGAIPTW